MAYSGNENSTLTFWQLFMERLEDGTVIRDVIGIVIVIFWLVTLAMGETPSMLGEIALLIVGYYFGVKDFAPLRSVDRVVSRRASEMSNGNGHAEPARGGAREQPRE